MTSHNDIYLFFLHLFTNTDIILIPLDNNNLSLFAIFTFHVDGLMQERHNSIANALELRLSCTNPSIYGFNPVILHCHFSPLHVIVILYNKRY